MVGYLNIGLLLQARLVRIFFCLNYPQIYISRTSASFAGASDFLHTSLIKFSAPLPVSPDRITEKTVIDAVFSLCFYGLSVT